MTTKLRELRVRDGVVENRIGSDFGKKRERPATVADLLDALREEGGEIVEAQVIGKPPLDWHTALPVSRRGRYLVFPIPVEVESPEVPT